MKNEDNVLSPVSKPDILSQSDACPSCFSDRDLKANECAYCGIVFTQFSRWSKEKRTKLTISGLHHLKFNDIEGLEMSWQKIESAYLNQDFHSQFIHQCLRSKSLSFAAHCYVKRLEIFPEDAIAQLQLDKVVSLAGDSFVKNDTSAAISSPFNRSLMKFAKALSVMGVIVGVYLLFIALMTTTPVFYLIFGLSIIGGSFFTFKISSALAVVSQDFD